MEEKMNVRQLEEKLRDIVKKIDDRERQRTVLYQLAKANVFLESVQRLPLLERLTYWQGYYVMFDYLRQNGQLGTNVNFDPLVRNSLDFVIRKLLYEDDGNGKD